MGPVSNHRPRPSSATLNHIADVLRVDRDKLETHLAAGADAVMARLQQLTAEELKPPASAIHRAPGT